jgi:hypothetical protein
MSLSFVSKSIQTTTEDGSFVEKPIEGAEPEGGEGGAALVDRRPLFEQLRENRERDEAEAEEQRLSLMRGTLALDEEDAAHLDSLRRQREREEREREHETAQELAAFRAARAELRYGGAGSQLNDGVGKDHRFRTPNEDAAREIPGVIPPLSGTSAPPSSSVGPSLPLILKRKRRRGEDGTSASSTAPGTSAAQKRGESEEWEACKNKEGESKCAGRHSAEGAKVVEGQDDNRRCAKDDGNTGGPADGIGGLLAGYDSSSSEEG